MAIRHMRIAWWKPKATDTLRICNIYCFSTAAVGTPILLTVTIIQTLRFLLTVAVATARSVTFSKAPPAQLQAHLVLCLATDAKRCVVYCGVTYWNFSGCQSIVYCMSHSFLSERRVIDGLCDVSAHKPTCTSPSILQTLPHWLKPSPPTATNSLT